MQRQKAVTAYFSSKQLRPLDLAGPLSYVDLVLIRGRSCQRGSDQGRQQQPRMPLTTVIVAASGYTKLAQCRADVISIGTVSCKR